MGYIEVMNELRLELAAEYLVMAAMLAEIKSRMLLPRPVEEVSEEDPRAELVRRLQEYERYKRAAESIDGLDQMGRDFFQANIGSEVCQPEKLLPQVTLQEMLAALAEVLKRAEHFSHHQIRREALSIREKMSRILLRLREEGAVMFLELLDPAEGRRGIVVSFLALLELTRESMITLTQCEAFAPIYAQAK
jgi:segregation and condensation protein A